MPQSELIELLRIENRQLRALGMVSTILTTGTMPPAGERNGQPFHKRSD